MFLGDVVEAQDTSVKMWLYLYLDSITAVNAMLVKEQKSSAPSSPAMSSEEVVGTYLQQNRGGSEYPRALHGRALELSQSSTCLSKDEANEQKQANM